MKITSVRHLLLSRPLERTQRNSCGSRDQRQFNVVIVETDAGLTGLGDAFGDTAIMPAVVERRIAPMAVGLDPRDPASVWKKLFTSRAFWETGGSVLCAASAVEVACWDILGQAEGVPVCELLGGRQRDRVEAYASDLHWDEPEYMAEVAAGYVERGFRYVKTHIGAPDEHERDLQRLQAMREAIGPDVGLMVDINTGLEREAALARGRDFAQFDPYWYEEPLCPIDFAGHAWLRQELPMRIATGENLYATLGFQPLWEAQACDFVMPDILRCGGIDQTRQICQAAVSHSVVPTLHNYSSGIGLAATLQLMAAMPEIQLLEYDPTGTSIYEELFIEPPGVSAGHVEVPTTPGLGLQLTAEVLSKYGS